MDPIETAFKDFQRLYPNLADTTLRETFEAGFEAGSEHAQSDPTEESE